MIQGSGCFERFDDHRVKESSWAFGDGDFEDISFCRRSKQHDPRKVDILNGLMIIVLMTTSLLLMNHWKLVKTFVHFEHRSFRDSMRIFQIGWLL